MTLYEKIAIIGHNGWAAQAIVKALAAQAFEQPIRIIAREQSSIDTLSNNVEVVHYSWDNPSSITSALDGVDILLSFIGHAGLKDQEKMVPYMRDAGVKLFAPSDLALPYTAEEREHVTVPREKEELEHKLHAAGVPFVTIVIGNFTSFALDSPYMGVDLVNNRILHTGESRTNPVYLCSRDYVAAGYASIFTQSTIPFLSDRTIGLNELHPTTADIEAAMHKKSGVPPSTAFDSLKNAAELAKQDRLDALVRKKMGDGTHNVGNDIWEVEGYEKKTLEDFIIGDALDDPPYIKGDEQTRQFLDEYFD
ncbi:hypothetical protein E4T47_01868 [Aureobasidium subglaciale]|nr:hypothetical protein E4T47_01868 [Aureobasidium subglaciale]